MPYSLPHGHTVTVTALRWRLSLCPSNVTLFSPTLMLYSLDRSPHAQPALTQWELMLVTAQPLPFVWSSYRNLLHWRPISSPHLFMYLFCHVFKDSEAFILYLKFSPNNPIQRFWCPNCLSFERWSSSCWLPCPFDELSLQFTLFPYFFSVFLLSGTTRCFMSILLIPYLSREISHLSKQPWFLLMENEWY